jgi:CubicO group peptidase (beta-lactamase class C family)
MEASMRQVSSFRKVIFSLILFFFFLSFLFSDEKTDGVDKLFAQWDKTTTPGCALAIVKDGQIIYKRGYGMAKLEDGIVMSPSKVFDIGSVSKQFTAACIAVLVEQGKISVNDDVRKYIPEMPKYEKPISINHLIHHTSGVRDYNTLLSLAGFSPDSDCPTVDEALEIICKQKRLNFLPGEEFSYSNSGYFLLSCIVERVSGKSLNEFAQDHIFRPLGMTSTIFQDDHTQIIHNRATGYSPGPKGFKINMSNWDETGDGNVYTSVEDLFLWDQAFYSNKLGNSLTDNLQAAGVLNSGKKLDYAFGLFIDEYKGLKTVSHGGAWAGFRAALVRFSEQKFSVICLANLSTINPSRLCLRVADIYLADQFKETPKEEKKKLEPVTLSKQELEEKCGNYQDDKFGMWITLSVKDEKLKMHSGAQEFSLSPLSATLFRAVDGPVEATIEFLPAVSGKPRRATLTMRGNEIFNLVKAAPLPALASAQLKEYLGVYESEELLKACYRLALEKDNLVVKARNFPKNSLKAMAPDKFTVEGINIEFVRGKGKRIAGFLLGVGRAGHIEFVRK